MDKDRIYLAALLHDVGKFLERAKYYGDKNLARLLLNKLEFSNKSYFFSSCLEEVIQSVLYHYEPRDDFERIIQLADWLSSSEGRDEKENTDNVDVYYKMPLQSIFGRLFKEEKKYGYKLKKMSLETIFPEDGLKEISYRDYVDDFLDELVKVNNESQLYYLLEKYLWSVPEQASGCYTDISLFDHSKTTAAIAVCLYHQYQAGELDKKELNLMTDSTKNQFLLINADISGIQDFIFNISSKGASKSLKGRSVYITLISEIVARYIIDELELKEANLLYNGGGNFYILAPACKEEKLKEVRKNILETLLNAHNGELYFAIAGLPFSPADFSNFAELWTRASRKVAELKQKKWSEIDLKSNFKKIFGPLNDGESQNNTCDVCGVSRKNRELISNEDDLKICSMCNSFIELTKEKLKEANYYIIKRGNYGENKSINNYNDVFKSFGYQIDFLKSFDNKKSSNELVYKINDTNFLEEGCDGFIFGAYNLPINEKGNLMTFEELAVRAVREGRGDKKLGVLKLDVDNLGWIFIKGFEKNKTISRITSLSRMLGLYFKGYINCLIKQKGWQNKIYVVFSGGDDTFIVGSWNTIIEFGKEFYERFRDYTCHHSKITFSAGISIFRYNFPVVKFAEITEGALERAKNFIEENEKIPGKNKISLFGEVFNWEEFKRIIEIKDVLIDIVKRNGNKRAILNKVMRSTKGFKKILEQSNKNLFDNLRFWRLVYYLRELNKNNKNDENDAEKIINIYQKIVINNLLHKKEVKKIMIIPVAVKMAEMETKKYSKGD
ncbi:type III-A CRISPR-associated protein Cas10/Csm1 [Anoxybacter fermentans]|uniref:CRISPR system single-strand-specific deoxyribonuclease Cas10/Csm1 (subtype III-A) n=1 Tax=Anoxybacter fermentans TaxID=1323375 RepID=A0A3Q9HP16_9FIRM|nr:type III-A CRISPR-associated protein Cas10/Csm1 [Anoxybacter fermentans]AZR72421.1 type III-A CRISPR-associated protein Cas10/Csm1 [Anoxybacter fermentans]